MVRHSNIRQSQYNQFFLGTFKCFENLNIFTPLQSADCTAEASRCPTSNDFTLWALLISAFTKNTTSLIQKELM